MEFNKKSKTMRWCVLIFILLGISPVVAQQDMTFEKALLTMLENSKLIKSEQYSIDAAYNELRAAKGLRWPKIDAVGSAVLMQKDVDIDFGGTKGVVTQAVNQLISDGVKSGQETVANSQVELYSSETLCGCCRSVAYGANLYGWTH